MKIGVIGTGYIGISTVLHYIKVGADVIGIDIDRKKVQLLRKGILPQKDLLEWLGFDVKPLLEKAKFYDNFDILEREKLDAIFVAIVTEKDGEPYFKALDDVINKIKTSKNKDTLIIIESTLMPGVSDRHIVPHLPNFAVAYRRDWFGDKTKTLETIPRIVGGNTKDNTDKAQRIINKVCRIVYTCTYKEAEVTKAVENSQRLLGIIYTDQLAFAYPDLDIRKILQLAGSKWNCITYYPSSKVGGYCIALAGKYILEGAGKNKKELTLLEEALKTDRMMSYIISRKIADRNPKSIAVLGTCYLADIKVDILSAGKHLLEALDAHLYKKDDRIKVYDSLYSEKEIKERLGYNSFKFPDDLDKFEYIFVMAGHKEFRELDEKIWIEKTKKAKLVFDNVGILEKVNFKCPYSLMGRPGWLKKLS